MLDNVRFCLVDIATIASVALTYPELVGSRVRARLVVLRVEVGGRWSTETQSFLFQVAKTKARDEVPLLCNRAEQTQRLRWGSLLSCTAARAVENVVTGTSLCPGC